MTMWEREVWIGRAFLILWVLWGGLFWGVLIDVASWTELLSVPSAGAPWGGIGWIWPLGALAVCANATRPAVFRFMEMVWTSDNLLRGLPLGGALLMASTAGLLLLLGELPLAMFIGAFACALVVLTGVRESYSRGEPRRTLPGMSWSLSWRFVAMAVPLSAAAASVIAVLLYPILALSSWLGAHTDPQFDLPRAYFEVVRITMPAILPMMLIVLIEVLAFVVLVAGHVTERTRRMGLLTRTHQR